MPRSTSSRRISAAEKTPKREIAIPLPVPASEFGGQAVAIVLASGSERRSGTVPDAADSQSSVRRGRQIRLVRNRRILVRPLCCGRDTSGVGITPPATCRTEPLQCKKKQRGRCDSVFSRNATDLTLSDPHPVALNGGVGGGCTPLPVRPAQYAGESESGRGASAASVKRSAPPHARHPALIDPRWSFPHQRLRPSPHLFTDPRIRFWMRQKASSDRPSAPTSPDIFARKIQVNGHPAILFLSAPCTGRGVSTHPARALPRTGESIVLPLPPSRNPVRTVAVHSLSGRRRFLLPPLGSSKCNTMAWRSAR